MITYDICHFTYDGDDDRLETIKINNKFEEYIHNL